MTFSMSRRLLLPVVLAGPIAIVVHASQPTTSPPEDVKQLATWLTGDFDNFQQVFEQKEARADQPHGRVHTTIAPITAPSIGDRVLLAAQSELNDVDRVAKVHLYRLIAEPGTPTVTLRLYGFADSSAVDAFTRTGKVDDAIIARARAMTGCDVTWRRNGDVFEGSMTPASCRVTWPPTGTPAMVLNSFRLAADEFWFSEQATDDTGKVIFGRADGVPYQLKRARPFSCYWALRKEGTTDQYDSGVDVPVHDQGKWVTLPAMPGTAKKYAFELAQLRYSQKVPVMTLKLYEPGVEQAFAYTWAETTSKKIGINLRWLQVGCSIKE